MPVDKELLEVLACPSCRAGLEEVGDEVACTGCGRRYPVRLGIPVMLIEEARLPGQEKKG